MVLFANSERIFVYMRIYISIVCDAMHISIIFKNGMSASSHAHALLFIHPELSALCPVA